MKVTGAKGMRRRNTSEQQAQDAANQSPKDHVIPISGQMRTHDTSAPGMMDVIQKLDTSKSAKELETDYADMEWKIHSFPASLHGVGKRYIQPKLVTIGPYHSTTDIENQGQNVAEMKEAAMRNFVVGGTDEASIKNSIENMFRIVSPYWRTDLYDKHRVPREYDGTVHYGHLFMMFRDGCFLLQFIRMCTISDHGLPEWLENWFDVNKTLICSDIMLLENQLPWVVLENLNELWPMSDRVPLEDFVAKMGRSLQVRGVGQQYVPAAGYKPPHLLGYLWHYKTGGSIEEPVSNGFMPMSKTVSVIELADISIYLTSSKTTQFKDMGIARKSCTGSGYIFLAPLLLDEVTSCWLVNMAAYEVCIATLTKNRVVSSYLGLLAMLMDGEQDVHELRANRIVQGDLTNKETLDFFKTLSKHIRPGQQYFHIMEQIESFRVSRYIWIEVHRLLYNSYSKRSFAYNYTKTIMTTFSFVAVLVAIFKVIFLFKMPQA